MGERLRKRQRHPSSSSYHDGLQLTTGKGYPGKLRERLGRDALSSDEDSEALGLFWNNEEKLKNARGKQAKPRNRAPAEMSSKKAVSRYRIVVPDSQTSSLRKRDRRFDTLSGKLNRGHWETAYSFLDEYKQSEIRDMKNKLKKAKTPEEKDQLHSIISKELNRVSERDRWKTRREIVQYHRRSERQAIAQGTKKNPYFLKRRDLKRKELETKFVKLKSEGKLDKYMQKRRKKNASKDRKRMPRNFG